MAPIDFILNLAGLLFWLNWRSLGSDPFATPAPATLAGTVRRAAPRRLKAWHLLLLLSALLFIRAVLYWQLGSAINWTAHLHLKVVSLPFRSDLFTCMLLFSVLSFALLLGMFYLCLLLLSLLNGRASEADPVQKLVRMYLGPVDRWPWPVKSILPVLIAAPFWLGLSWLLARQNILDSAPVTLRLQQGVVIGLSAYLSWQYLVTALLALYILASYVYLGNHSIWAFINVSARTLLGPLRRLPLRLGKIDLAPLVVIAGVLLAAQFAGNGLALLYERLPW